LLRGQPLSALALVAVTLVGAGLTAAATYRAVAPLGAEALDEPPAGSHTRATLERDKALTLRSIKELEFDHSMGKVSDADFAEMRDRLRARAVRLMTDLEGSQLYRQQIERDAAALGEPVTPSGEAAAAEGRTCPACGTVNDVDARFCKHCGAGVTT